MKKQFFSLAFVALTGITFAQKGSWYIGGALGFSANNTKVDGTVTRKTSSWSVSPEIGTFLTNRVQLGLAVNTGGMATENINSSKTTGTNFGGTLYGRYFFGDLAFKPFVAVNVTALAGNSTTEDFVTTGSTKNDLFNFGANLNCGFGYAIAPRFTVVGSFGLIGYSMETVTPESGLQRVESGFSTDLSSLGNRFTIGFYYTFKEAKGE